MTKTLSGASQDLLHFSIVLVSVYVCLAVAAVLLFGEDVEEFATLDRLLQRRMARAVGAPKILRVERRTYQKVSHIPIYSSCILAIREFVYWKLECVLSFDSRGNG